ncbi:magnesium transporter CorA family protein [Haloimpatiens sp. FM7330]|uniref:magnesium transporter CorA family protein n=1 Tax=Haloimpatiens sp. FM7330 TaxID=3298610 RepID=UPI0036323EEF
MISIFKSIQDKGLKEIEDIQAGCWINMVAPSDEEIALIAKKTGAPIEYLKAALDEEESSRLEVEDDNILIIVDIPFTEMEYNSLTYDTYPLAIIHTKNEIVTVCLKDSKILKGFTEGKVTSFHTFKRSRFILQILYRIANFYLIYLRQIDKKSVLVEKQLHKSMKNRELIQLLALEKSLVYFSTSLKANEMTLEKMLKLYIIQKYVEDKDVLEDVIVENKQAIEMCNIYSNILSGTMDAYASVISNNLNIVMKFLAAITIVMSIPNMVSGLFGMNVRIPFQNSPYGFWFVIAIVAGVSATVTWVLSKKGMF